VAVESYKFIKIDAYLNFVAIYTVSICDDRLNIKRQKLNLKNQHMCNRIEGSHILMTLFNLWR